MTQPKPPKVGAPLDLTPEQLDQAAIVTPVDVAMARALWLQALVGTRFERLASLLDAAPEQES